MRWPIHTVERVRPSRFHPPFCPWPECKAHLRRGVGFHKHGSYRRKHDPTRIPRFKCRDCEHTCSRQTFSTTYYLKRPGLQARIAAALAACSAHRQIARSERCAKTTVTRQAERLGRHAILFCARMRSKAPPISEPMVHDHFESFVSRQDRALAIGTAVGARSWFVYDIDPAPHRGSGRRPDRQPDSQAKATPDGSYVRSISRTISSLIARVPEHDQLVLRVDGRLDYLEAVRRSGLASRLRMEIFPNPKRGAKGSPRSLEAIERDFAMFPVDQLHQLLRHTCSDHKRETIAFGRRAESILGRAHLIAVWKNFIKKRTERRPSDTTPAMVVGLTDARWTWERVLSRRLFARRERVSEIAKQLYAKRLTAGLPELRLRRAG
jgi:transposase-like protein